MDSFHLNCCRICLREEKILLLMDAHPAIYKKVEETTCMQLQKGDNFPTKICTSCLNNINVMYNFRKLIISNERELIERNEYIQKAKTKEVVVLIQPELTLDKLLILQQVQDPDKLLILQKVENPEKMIIQQIETPEEVRKRHKRMAEKKALSDLIPKFRKCKGVYQCSQCPETFTTPRRVKLHKSSVHIRRVKCDVCGVVVRAENISQHKTIHVENPVKCEICGNQLKNRGSLKAHKRFMHTGRLFTCHVCGTSTAYLKNLRQHMQRMHGVGNYPTTQLCNICGKSVADLKRHLNTHTKEHSYKCKYCGKCLTTPYSLKVHERLHTKEHPFQCDLCPMNFPQMVSLKNHYRSMHPGRTFSYK